MSTCKYDVKRNSFFDTNGWDRIMTFKDVLLCDSYVIKLSYRLTDYVSSKQDWKRILLAYCLV